MTVMPRPNPHVSHSEPSDTVPTYDARALVADGVQARIVLDGQPYVLRITRADKLILTK